jgi:hypothetical protein
MSSLLSGFALIGTSLALIYQSIPREGVASTRYEWANIAIAIGFSAGLAVGLGLIVAGITSFWL